MEVLRMLHKAVSARIDGLTNIMVEEYVGVVQFTAPTVQAGADVFLAAEKALQELPLTRSWGKTTVTMEPVGVAGLISPWNANALFLGMKVASAIAAGCTVVMKPSELSALQTQVWLECVQEAKLPKGFCNVGRGDVVEAELVRNPDVLYGFGCRRTVDHARRSRDDEARHARIGRQIAQHLLEDADLKKAIPNAFVIVFLNSGQSLRRGGLVPKSRFAEIKLMLVDAIPAFPVGDPADPKTAVGPMVSKKQHERVQSYIRTGIEEGAEVLIGGEGHPSGLGTGYFVRPTVFVNVKNDMTIAREEIFGPVLCVITDEDEEDAIRIANDTEYGLHAFVSSADVQRARRVSSQLQVGRVAINGILDDQQAPFGGFKHSGVGREFGTYGIEAFLEPKAILE
jgi:aldehyde dehydrogenase (NAD+)